MRGQQRYLAGQEMDLRHGIVPEFGQRFLQCLRLWVPAGAVQVESTHQHAILRRISTLVLPQGVSFTSGKACPLFFHSFMQFFHILCKPLTFKMTFSNIHHHMDGWMNGWMQALPHYGGFLRDLSLDRRCLNSCSARPLPGLCLPQSIVCHLKDPVLILSQLSWRVVLKWHSDRMVSIALPETEGGSCGGLSSSPPCLARAAHGGWSTESQPADSFCVRTSAAQPWESLSKRRKNIVAELENKGECVYACVRACAFLI